MKVILFSCAAHPRTFDRITVPLCHFVMFSELLSSMYMPERAAGRQALSQLTVFASNKYQWEGTGPRVPA